MSQEHCEACGEFLPAGIHVYCNPCMQAETDENGVIKVSTSKLNICKYILENESRHTPEQVAAVKSRPTTIQIPTTLEAWESLQIPGVVLEITANSDEPDVVIMTKETFELMRSKMR